MVQKLILLLTFADWMRDAALPDMNVVVLLLSLGMLKSAV